MTTLTFHNGTKALLIGVGERARITSITYSEEFKVLTIWGYPGPMHRTREPLLRIMDLPFAEYNLLGVFALPCGFGFGVQEELVKWFYGAREEKLYQNYDLFNPKVTIMPAAFLTKEESLASYLQSEITKANLKEKKFVIVEIK